jgi:DNA-binding NtrC family response regulator
MIGDRPKGCFFVILARTAFWHLCHNLKWDDNRASTLMTIAQLRAHQKILVVDDDDFFRFALSKSLKRRGFQIAEANCGEAALRILELADPKVDLVLVDVVMPGMTGITLAGRIESAHPGIKTLFISGYPFATLEREYGMSGDFLPYFLQKPFGMEALGAKVNEVLAWQEARGTQ